MIDELALEFDLLVSVASGVTKDRNLAKDVVQDFFLKVLEKGYVCESPIAYARISVYRMAIEALGREKRFVDWRTIAASEFDVGDKVLLEEIDIIVNRLSAFDRMVFHSCYGEGVKVKEISSETGIPERTIYDSLTRTKNYIKTKIG